MVFPGYTCPYLQTHPVRKQLTTFRTQKWILNRVTVINKWTQDIWSNWQLSVLNVIKQPIHTDIFLKCEPMYQYMNHYLASLSSFPKQCYYVQMHNLFLVSNMELHLSNKRRAALGSVFFISIFTNTHLIFLSVNFPFASIQ